MSLGNNLISGEELNDLTYPANLMVAETNVPLICSQRQDLLMNPGTASIPIDPVSTFFGQILFGQSAFKYFINSVS